MTNERRINIKIQIAFAEANDKFFRRFEKTNVEDEVKKELNIKTIDDKIQKIIDKMWDEDRKELKRLKRIYN